MSFFCQKQRKNTQITIVLYEYEIVFSFLTSHSRPTSRCQQLAKNMLSFFSIVTIFFCL